MSNLLTYLRAKYIELDFYDKPTFGHSYSSSLKIIFQVNEVFNTLFIFVRNIDMNISNTMAYNLDSINNSTLNLEDTINARISEAVKPFINNL